MDANGRNVSTASVTVTALRIEWADGTVVRSLNGPFTFVANGPNSPAYRYTVSTRDLTSSSYKPIVAAGDPVEHTAPFGIK